MLDYYDRDLPEDIGDCIIVRFLLEIKRIDNTQRACFNSEMIRIRGTSLEAKQQRARELLYVSDYLCLLLELFIDIAVVGFECFCLRCVKRQALCAREGYQR